MVDSSLEKIIDAEIKNDEFYQFLQYLAATEDIQTILEIGSSSGGGSTEALVNGIQQNPHQPQLYCMEVSKTRFQQLQQTYQNQAFVHCYNVSSVPVNSFPSEAQVREFYNTHATNLNLYPLEQVLSWRQQDISYLENQNVIEEGIERIKTENNIEYFDMVLIDGSEFTGSAELAKVYGATFILLDDINTYKNYHSHHQLCQDPNYKLLKQNLDLRNGYSIFKKINSQQKELSHILQKITSTWREQEEQKFMRSLISEDAIAFDIGAASGSNTLLISQWVGYFGKVYAFEPTESLANNIQTNIERYHLNNTLVIQKAITNQIGEIDFYEFPQDFANLNSIQRPSENISDPKILDRVQNKTVTTTTLDQFCQQQKIEKIDYIKLDLPETTPIVLQGASQLLATKAIHFLQFIASPITVKTTSEVLKDYGYECHCISERGEIGENSQESNAEKQNYIAFPKLPIHFFTIVLNGEPFIRYHIDTLKQLPFPWHWHIVEGVADLKHDTAWSVQLGGNVSDDIHQNGRSIDGTSEYLDQLAAQYPDQITLYRKPAGEFWDGKREMVNAPLPNIQENCLLWQIDVDELWTVEQLYKARNLFIKNPKKTAAYYWCWYFVGEDLAISTRNCYAQNPKQDWLRTWRYQPGYLWLAHEPPVLAEPLSETQFRRVDKTNPFNHAETETAGLVFQHFAYLLPEQLQFKEQYYGYRNALNFWQSLQAEQYFPVMLREYFPWVGDDTMVDRVDVLGVTPLLQKDDRDRWQFVEASSNPASYIYAKVTPRIAVDGVFFQRYHTGIARVWQSLFKAWVDSGFARHLLVLDRGGTAPKIPGIRYRTIPPHDYQNLAGDRALLQAICDEEEIDLFISTYYSFPAETPSALLVYDMIAECLPQQYDLQSPMWQEKQEAIRRASAFMAISENSARDLQYFFPEVESVTVTYVGVADVFRPATQAEVATFKFKYGITKPYFLVVGAYTGYKNTILFFQAFSQLCTKQGFEIVCTGNQGGLVEEFRQCTQGTVVHSLNLADEELRLAYAGAVALVYPSKYEGFGMPVLEALACACPVITCRNASLPEVAGEAALYIRDDSVEDTIEALCDIQKKRVRETLIPAGLTQAQQFSWQKMAVMMQSVLIETTLQRLHLRKINLVVFPDWSLPEDEVGSKIQNVIASLSSHPHPEQVTLLIDTTGISLEDAELLLSAMAMNLLMMGVEVSEDLAISWVGDLSSMQWEALLPRLHRRVALESENTAVMVAVGAEDLPLFELG
ncbi:MAG: FkbM family methyltransferase [Jaaginema sp. PMC 1079.18]|nr:FkbM family methyltransferase [Jaaginema sp. PMC 1080.18]MEC4850457.1 FkbM family methyltransferase [Jaaginema sp. PMC 1079.18]MEC4867521.1 FkbM family methyltransferase [Jaaginema sp. PMC 1078.18]